MAEQYGVQFLYRDFRPLFREGQDFAREHGMYMQKYCGCIFSEEDRYRKKKKTAQ
jgi:predicted adenine nucleotide alpha hydrolase (AANH) superfamily ATPase